jgi:molybdate transport system substrate-binding protein
VGSGPVDPDGVGGGGERSGAGASGASGAATSGGSGLRIFAAGMLRPGFDVLVGAGAGAEDGGGGRGAGIGRRAVRVDYANARDLAERIVGGEEVDVFASASPDHPRELRAAGLVGEPSTFASNSLVVAVPVGSDARDYRVLGEPGRRVVIEVGGIPLGDYTRELLARVESIAGRGFGEAVLGNVVFEAQTVFEVGDALVDGRADAGVLYATDVAARGGRLRAIELPGEAKVGVTCVACVVSASRRPAEAAGWIEELVAARGQAILREAGFGPPMVG